MLIDELAPGGEMLRRLWRLFTRDAIESQYPFLTDPDALSEDPSKRRQQCFVRALACRVDEDGYWVLRANARELVEHAWHQAEQRFPG